MRALSSRCFALKIQRCGLRQLAIPGQHVNVSAVAWSEFLCGPVTPAEAREGRSLVDQIEPFGELDAQLAADLFNRTGRRARTLSDCMIAAVALGRGASLATLNNADFHWFERFGLMLM